MRTPEERSRAVGTVLILLVLFVIFGGLLFWMYSVKLLVIPERVASLLGIDNGGSDETVQWDPGELSGIIMNGRPEEVEGVSFELTFANLREALLTEPVSDGFRQIVRVSRAPESQNSRPERIVICRSGENTRIERYETLSGSDKERRTELIIVGKYSVYRLDELSGESRSLPRGDLISPENEAGLPSVQTLMSIVAGFEDADELPESGEAETDAPDEIASESVNAESSSDVTMKERYTGGELKMLRTDYGNVYYVSFTDELIGTREEYWISLRYSVVLSHKTWYGDELLYSCETLDFSIDPGVWDKTSLYEPE